MADKTRMEIWKDYREEISKNIVLKEALTSSNEEYKLFIERIKSVFPTFKIDGEAEANTDTVELNVVNEYEDVDLSNMRKIMDFVESVNKESFKETFVDKLSFSSGELDDIFEMFAEREKEVIKRAKDKITGETEEVKFIKLDKGGIKVDKKIRIAIDGPSGTGKTTISRLLANRLDYSYISTGLVYRSFALIAFKAQIEYSDADAIVQEVAKHKIELLKNEKVNIDGEDVTIDLRADAISQGASKISANPSVREVALKIQRSYGEHPGVIMDGRDTTYRVMPNAELKLYIDTKAEVRAKRRVKQNEELGFSTDYDQVLADIQERDHRDKTRATDPLQVVDDAIYIDSTNMTETELLDHITGLVSAAITE